MTRNPNLEKANIFLGGNIGIDLKNKDPFRHLSLMMYNPDSVLLTAENNEICQLIKKWEKLDLQERREQLDEFIKEFLMISENGYLFKQFSELLLNYNETTTRNASIVAEKPDELSVKSEMEKAEND